MATMPSSVAEFLAGKRFAVAGVSRQPQQAANAVFKKLRNSGFEVFPVNPNATEVEGVRCYPNLVSIHNSIDGVVVATHPRNSLVWRIAASVLGRFLFAPTNLATVDYHVTVIRGPVDAN